MQDLERGIAWAKRGHFFLSGFGLVLGLLAVGYGLSESNRPGFGIAGLGGFVVVGSLAFAIKTALRPWGRVALGWIQDDPLPIVWVYPKQKGSEMSLVICRRDGVESSIPLNHDTNVDALLDALRTGPLPHARFGYRDDWAVEFRKDASSF